MVGMKDYRINYWLTVAGAYGKVKYNRMVSKAYAYALLKKARTRQMFMGVESYIPGSAVKCFKVGADDRVSIGITVRGIA
jgi:hypothetical protein